ncbi:hypothetical protein OKW34_004039 [Paraburkholderia youngii]
MLISYACCHASTVAAGGERGCRAAQWDRAVERGQLRRGLADARQRAQGSLAVADYPERVAAESCEMRIRHAQRGTDRDSRFDRIAAGAQHVASGLARQHVGAGDHAAGRAGESRVAHRSLLRYRRRAARELVGVRIICSRSASKKIDAALQRSFHLDPAKSTEGKVGVELNTHAR